MATRVAGRGSAGSVGGAAGGGEETRGEGTRGGGKCAGRDDRTSVESRARGSRRCGRASGSARRAAGDGTHLTPSAASSGVRSGPKEMASFSARNSSRLSPMASYRGAIGRSPGSPPNMDAPDSREKSRAPRRTRSRRVLARRDLDDRNATRERALRPAQKPPGLAPRPNTRRGSVG